MDRKAHRSPMAWLAKAATSTGHDSRNDVSGREIRLHCDQPFHGLHLAPCQKNVGEVKRRPRLARSGNLKITRTQTERGAKQVGAEFLEADRVGIETLCAATDQMLDYQLTWPNAPIGQAVENEEKHEPNRQKDGREYKIKASVHVDGQVWNKLCDVIPPTKPCKQNCDECDSQQQGDRIDTP
jgi:hypothetical protein